MINRTRHSYLIIMIILAYNSFLQAYAVTINPEQYIFKHLTVENDLVQNSVHAIHQDSNGFMWFGTSNGLSRYDGYEFRNYYYDLNTNHGLPASTINAIIEDNNGFLWLGTDKGLVKFDMRLEKFFLYSCDKKNKNSVCNFIYDILLDDNKIWLGTQGGLFLFNTNTNEMKKIDLGSNEYDNIQRISSIAKSKAGIIWLACRSNGLIKLNTRSFQWQRFNISKKGNYKLIMAVALYNDEVWIGSEDGLYTFNEKSNHFTHLTTRYDLNSLFILNLFVTHNALWAGTSRGGLYKYMPGQKGEYLFQYNPNYPYSIASNSLSSLYMSDDNTLWIGSENEGISFTNLQQEYRIYKNIPGNKNSLQNNLVNQIFYDNNNNLWFRAPNGISRYNEKLNYYKHYSLPYRIRGIHQSSAGFLWITTQAGLYKWDNKEDSINKIVDLHFTGISALYQLNNRELILANVGGKLIHWKIGEKDYRSITIEPGNKHTSDFKPKIAIGNVSFFEKFSNELWVGTESGLYSLNLQTLKLFSLPVGKLRSQLDNTIINHITIDEHGNNWIATTNKGLFKVDPSLHILNRFTRNDGLPDNTVRAIATTGKSTWVSTDNGLARIYAKENKSVIDVATKAFFNGEFQQASVLKVNNKRLIFGSVNGALEFNPLSYDNNQFTNQVQFTGFRLLNNAVSPGSQFLSQSIQYENSITLNHKQNLISFSYSALNYQNPNLYYAYQLQGYDNSDWFFMNHKNRRAVFTALPGGTYTLKVKATNSLNNWDTPETYLTIHITPPWWKTTWAYIAYITFIIVIFLIIMRYRTYRLIKLAQQLEHKVVERTEQVQEQKNTIEQLLDKKNEMFANISHELRTPITLIQGPIKQTLDDSISDHHRKPLTLANRNVQRLSYLVDQLLQLSHMYHFTEESKCPSSLSKAADLVAASFQSISASQDIKLDLTIKEDIWVSAIPNSLETLLINLLSNAFKYTEPGGQVSLFIKSSGQQATIQVNDTGIGIAEDQLEKIFNRFTRLESSINHKVEGVGVGLALVKQLVDMHKGNIKVKSILRVGSEFTVVLPRMVTEQYDQQKLTLAKESINQLHHLETQFRTADNNNPVVTENEPDTTVNTLHPKLLIIDDTEDMREHLESLLSHQYHCLSANNGEDGIETAKNEMPDIIITDVMMPGISGFEVLDRLRDDLNTSHIPVLMLTARGDKESKVIGLSKLADDYITKPFDADELKARLHGILAIRKLQQQQLHHMITNQGMEEKNWNHLDLSPKEKELVNKVNHVLNKNYRNSDFNVKQLAKEACVSVRSLQYKIQALSGKTPNEYIREYRLNKAKDLLYKKDIKFAFIAEHVGFTSTTYFNKCFKAHMGCTPKEFYQGNRK